MQAMLVLSALGADLVLDSLTLQAAVGDSLAYWSTFNANKLAKS